MTMQMTTQNRQHPVGNREMQHLLDWAESALTLEQLIEICVQLQPEEAAVHSDSALCVTPLITRLIIDGEPVELKLKEGRWGAAYPRVSGEVQRAAGSTAGKTTKKARRRISTQQMVGRQQTGQGAVADKATGAADGYSEEEQLMRQIRYFVREGLAFKVYSDCGLTGEYPCNEPRLIHRLLEGKAARYRKIYERTLLDETSLLRRTPEQVMSMRAYLDRRVAQILDGQVTDNEFAASDSDDAFAQEALGEEFSDSGADSSAQAQEVSAPQQARRRPGRPRTKVYFRQAFTQLWRDIKAGLVCTVAVSDRSRLCRAADLESEFLLLLARHSTRLVGLIEDLSTLDVSDPLKKGFAYMIASVNEYRLEEIAGHAFRGFLQLLESGHPHGRLPWWLIRSPEGKAVEMPEYVPYARRVAELYLSGLGVAAIITRLHSEGVLVGAEPLTPKMVAYVLDSDAVSGIQHQFGLAWDIFPPLLTVETVAELRERRLSRRDILVPQFGARVPGRTWANHAFTGLLRCACGLLLRYSHPSRTQRAAGRVGYYYCPAPHKRDREAAPHAYMNEDKLAAFLNELLGENPRLIADAVSGGGDRAAKSAARHALVEARLGQARQAYADKEAAARAKAAQTAVAAGISEQSASFASVVTEISRGLLEGERDGLAALEGELAHLSAQAGQDKQSARVLAAVEQLGGEQLQGELCPPGLPGAGSLDVRTRNSLLKAIFREITIHPLGPKTLSPKMEQGRGTEEERGTECGAEDATPRGCLVLHLAGVETPLPPVRMRRGRGKDLRLPSVAEWITDIYALAPVEEEGEVVLNARTMRAFHAVMTRLGDILTEDTPVGRLVARIRADGGFPCRSRGKDTIAAYLADSALYDGAREHLDAAWEQYRAIEQARLQARLAAPKSPPAS